MRTSVFSLSKMYSDVSSGIAGSSARLVSNRDKFLRMFMLLEGRMGFESGRCRVCSKPGTVQVLVPCLLSSLNNI